MFVVYRPMRPSFQVVRELRVVPNPNVVFGKAQKMLNKYYIFCANISFFFQRRRKTTSNSFCSLIYLMLWTVSNCVLTARADMKERKQESGDGSKHTLKIKAICCSPHFVLIRFFYFYYYYLMINKEVYYNVSCLVVVVVFVCLLV